MDRGQLEIGQVYGYAVCLVAIVTFLAASGMLAGAILDFREPPYTETYRSGPTLVSPEAYRMELLEGVEIESSAETAESLIPSDSTFREMYEQERLYRLAVSHQASRRRIVVSLVLLGAAVAVFAWHWLWLRRRERSPTMEAE